MSLWKLIAGRWDSAAGATDDIRIDASTNSLQTVDYAHHEVHAGSAFNVYVKAAGGSGTKATLTFQTPNTTKWPHFVFSVISNVEAQVTFGEGATVTGASGSDLVPFNRNRNSATAPTLLSAGSAGGAGSVTEGATVTDFGAQLVPAIQIGDGKTGGESREVEERVLKQNTVYAVEVETQAAGSEVSIKADWYEHTDKH